jgi:ABC-2 type transport system ATP-binding protein
MLHNGEIRAQGSMAELQQQFGLANASLDEIYLALTEEA